MSDGNERSWLWYVGRTLGVIWLLPATVLVWLFYVLPMWLIAGDLVFVRWAQYGVAEFVLADKALEAWHVRLWRDWAGWAGPCVFVWKGDPHVPFQSTRLHEMEHCHQQFCFGLMFYPAYLLASVFIWIFVRDKHSYYDNPFEVAARRAAGQTVVAPPGGWSGRDRWVWWILLFMIGDLTRGWF